MKNTDAEVEKIIKKYPEIGAIYKHYKGGKYKVLTMAKHSETDEDLVIYQSIGYGSFYARPLSMWFDEVKFTTRSGYNKAIRFEII